MPMDGPSDGSIGCHNFCKTEGLHQKGTLKESSFKDCGAEGEGDDTKEDNDEDETKDKKRR